MSSGPSNSSHRPDPTLEGGDLIGVVRNDGGDYGELIIDRPSPVAQAGGDPANEAAPPADDVVPRRKTLPLPMRTNRAPGDVGADDGPILVELACVATRRFIVPAEQPPLPHGTEDRPMVAAAAPGAPASDAAPTQK